MVAASARIRVWLRSTVKKFSPMLLAVSSIAHMRDMHHITNFQLVAVAVQSTALSFHLATFLVMCA